MAPAVFLLVASLSAAGAVDNVRADIARQFDEILAGPAFKDAKVGVHVMRLDDGAEIYNKNPDTAPIPASTVKVVTASAALYHLSPDYRFRTEVYARPEPDGTVRGDLYLKGHGDPWLLPERLWFLATRLYYQGVRTIYGNLVVDDTFFDGPRLANGWEQDESSNAYMAPAGALSVGFNAVMVHVMPAAAGQDARVLVDPDSAYAKVVGSVRTVSRGRTNIWIETEPAGDRSIVKVSGRVSASEGPRGYWRRVDNPPVFAGEVFRTVLKQSGVTLKGRVVAAVVPADAPRILTLTSPRLADLLEQVNKHSNNFMAEQVARTMGAEVYGPPGNWNNAHKAISAFLEEQVGLERGSYKIANASGLHDVNRFSPRQIVRVLDYMYRQPQLRPEFVASLAVAGGTGTLAERMRDTDATRLVRAKTGTLSNASALSGYVTTKSGETLAFSILVNDYKPPVSDVWRAQDRMGAALAGTSSSPAPGAPTTAHAAPVDAP
ncbi:MAG: D-alanyl-D-alanine carboxypeptidase/D-alanyl-D-alanine-endopeptidase [Deltaproteobacteria bacterium]|nr:D-alanyl-D-alanine carboxypeptidase/D-alanyl-D-alanine-endopeptidase [Deltaproteobacteria bacterium]